jgi:hypothetical protein
MRTVLHALGLGLHDHRLEVVDVAVHIAVGKQADEMNHAPSGLGAGHDLLPGLALPDRARGNGIGHQRRALAIDLAGADGVVADLGVAHVVIGRHADRGAVGAQGDVGVLANRRSSVGLRAAAMALPTSLGMP